VYGDPVRAKRFRRQARLGPWRAAAACALALALAPDAGARKFQMSGSWILRNGSTFVPLQWASTAMGGAGPMNHASMGNLTSAIGTPNGPVPGEGGVTATGSAPATLRIPPHRFVQDAMAAVALNGITLVQLTTNVGVDGPHAAATLAPGLGPGSFTWCPTDPACVAGGGMFSTDPPFGMGSRPGRVIYRAGANRFGGAMQMGLRRGGVVSFVFDAAPFQVGHLVATGSGSALRALAPGGLGAADLPATEKVYLERGFVTQPLTFMAGSLIVNPGPKLTTMLGLTNTMTGPTFYLAALGTTPMGMSFGQFTTHYGFAHTTGTAIAQQFIGTAGVGDFFTLMGSDARTALGAGNLSVVAGGLSFRTSLLGTRPWATFHKVRLVLGAPIPSLSPASAGAAAALVLVAAGYALRRRG
jgi:hypothetical protein